MSNPIVIGGIEATVTSASPTSLDVTVPNDTGFGPVRLQASLLSLPLSVSNRIQAPPTRSHTRSTPRSARYTAVTIRLSVQRSDSRKQSPTIVLSLLNIREKRYA
ncbi:uncharacterized protein METZ01_LOCUS455105 [marine metagenome]|uniref:Uncharacterized protein n=1 Tax=marine metagenome TaxID=408172 RepID=A0A383A3P8_9ZZZZ